MSFFQAGHLGVDLFFVLSGCLLGRPFVLAMLEKTATPSWKEFWLHRCRRILPAYWFQLVLLLLFLGAENYDAQTLLTHVSLSFNFLKNTSAINPVYWSLPVEWNFYILFPLLALTFKSSRNFLLLIAGSILFAFAFRLLCWHALFNADAGGIGVFRLVIQLPARIDQFMIGVFATWLLITKERLIIDWNRFISMSSVLVIATSVWLVLSHGEVLDRTRLPWAYFQQTITAIGFAGLIVAAGTSSNGLSRIWSTRFMQFIGTISYSLYLWHFPVGQFLSKYYAPGPIFIVLFIGGSLLLAYLSWRFVESVFIAKKSTGRIEQVQ